MKLTALGWTRIAVDPVTKERAFGRKLVQAYDMDAIFSSPDMAWFREAVQDVRDSMELDGGELMVNEVRIYEELGLEPPCSSRWGECLQAVRRAVNGPARRRRGFVHYGDTTVICFSTAGIKVPRIVYEEAAHSIYRVLPLEQSDRHTHSQDFDKYLHSLAVDTPHAPRSKIHWPIECHLDIYRGFLNGSAALRRSAEEDRWFVRNQVKRLESVLPCRRLKPPSRNKACPCPLQPAPR